MSGKTVRVAAWVAGVILLPAAAFAAYWMETRRPAIPTIAFVPQTAGAMLWDVEHFGATAAAESVKCHLYWNAPTSETDVAGQVLLIDKVSRGKYQGLVIAPNHPRAPLAPLRRALAAGLPIVIVSAQLDIPAGAKLGYVVNDDEKMGELAAAEMARLLNGRGTIALAGLARYAPGVATRVRSAERFLVTHFPDIQIVGRLPGAYHTGRAEEVTGSTVDSHPGLNGVLSFTASSTRGVHSALKRRALAGSIRLVGCEQDADLLGFVTAGEIDAIVAENTFRMGYEAVELISASWAGNPIPARSVVPPLLITKENFNTEEAAQFIRFPR